jgi:hypothetical protein
MPINPGPAATFPDALTGAQIANIRQDHDKLEALFVEYYASPSSSKSSAPSKNSTWAPFTIASQASPKSPPDRC